MTRIVVDLQKLLTDDEVGLFPYSGSAEPLRLTAWDGPSEGFDEPLWLGVRPVKVEGPRTAVDKVRVMPRTAHEPVARQADASPGAAVERSVSGRLNRRSQRYSP